MSRLSELGFTQESFAHEVGVSLRTVQRWVAGTQIPNLTPRKTLHVCQVLKLSLEDFASAFPDSNEEQKNA